MRRRILFSAAAAASLLAVCAGSASAAIPGTAPITVRGAAVAGAYQARSMTVTIALAPRPGLAGLLAAQRAGRAGALSTREFEARFAPSPAAVRAVRRFAAAHALRVSSVSANRTLVSLTGSSTAVARAFGTSFESLRSSAGTFFAPRRAARLPAALAGRTAAVLGLSSIGRVSLPLHKRGTTRAADIAALPHALTSAATGINYPAEYGPQDFWSLYNAPSGATGSGQTLAVIAEGDLTQPKRDLVTFEQQFGLPQVTWTTVGPGSSDTSGSDEWDLDTQYSTGFAPGVTALRVYDGASLSNADITTIINRWVTDNATRQASFSAGECESLAQVSGFEAALDTVLQQAVAQGQTLFSASGDSGSFCPALVGVNGVPAGLPGTEYPASSPFGIGVGGTSVLGSGPTEIAWYAAGGGSTFFESTPSWQQNAGGSFTGVMRGVPDVALDADPESGYRVIVNGSELGIGGTSASTPAWQGIWARAQGAHGGNVGFAGPVIYGEPATAFNDVLVGAIGFYAATPGWDYTTGRGTPDITAFVNGA